MATPMLLRCSTTGLMVQIVTELADPPADGSRQYKAIECPACQGLHLINIATGKTPSEEAGE